MPFDPFPVTACWRHVQARAGFEVAWFRARDRGWRIDGTTTALEDGQTWAVTYHLDVDADWATRRARIAATTVDGHRETELTSDGAGHWLVDGAPAPGLDGCLDVDLESSAMTNTLPVHRLDPRPGAGTGAPAAYVRAVTLTASRLDQVYRRVPGHGPGPSFDYSAPAFSFTARLVYDRYGLIVGYPGIADRAG